MKNVCMVGNTGIPSSMNITYSTPRIPRMVMFSLTSPPELSTRVKPGTYRSISVVLRGAACVMSAALRTVVALLVSSLVRGVSFAVTTTASRCKGSATSVKLWALRCPTVTVTVAV